MIDYELQLSSGKRVVWSGKDGIDACRRYVESHPGECVVAWRSYPQHGIFLGTLPIIE